MESRKSPKSGSEIRTRSKHIHVRVSPAELKSIREIASVTQMTAPHLLRTLALNHRVVPAVDPSSLTELLKIAADLGRLGGLLKLWLTQHDNQDGGVSKGEIRYLLNDIEDTSSLLKKKIKELAK